MALLAAPALLGIACQQAPTVGDGSALDDGREWLNAAKDLPPTAPALQRAAVASAFNQAARSESLLVTIIRADPTSDSARGAHLLLSRLYLRSGQYARLITNLDEWNRAFPDSADVRKEKADIEQFRGLPDQVNGPQYPTTLLHGGGNDFSVPVVINGKPATYLMDTGAWMSVMTEPEASRLGMTIREGSGVLGESSGKGARVRFAVASELVLGSMTFRNVSFAILPDQEPWSSMPTGRGGIIGVPILLHLGCVRWVKGGSWEIDCGPAPSRPDSMNLVFFENHLLVAAIVSGTRQFGALDTGAETTDLNVNFARQFGEIIGKGMRESTSVEGAGGTTTIEAITVPEVALDIGGTTVGLRPAHVTLQQNPSMGGRCCIGNFGLDLLLQREALTIDFTAMTLRLR